MGTQTPTLPLAFALSALLVATPVAAQQGTPSTSKTASDLHGLWAAKLRYGPDIRGTLTIVHEGQAWRGNIAGYDAPVSATGDRLTFTLPSEQGDFRGQISSNRKAIEGFWLQSRMMTNGSRFESPCRLERVGSGEMWRGRIDPLDDELTMYLKVVPLADGSVRAFLKNPERNIGWFTRVAFLERSGDTVQLLGEPDKDGKKEKLSEGTFDPAGNMLSIPLRGGTYDFSLVNDSTAIDYYPRSFPGVGKDYVYREPVALNDGWPVATPEAVGMSREALQKLVRTCIDMPIDSVQSLELHGVLVARHGKLVLEEYFHGESRDKPHDTRSAAKIVADVLAGAAMQSGVRLSSQSKVYEVMNGGAMPAGLEPRKQALTLEHLLTMSSGLDMDDNDDNSKGAEDRVSESGVKDVWKFTLALDTVRDPGTSARYASLSPNLVGGMIRQASGRPLTDLFHDLLAKPMQIDRFWFGLMGNGEPYMGGGMRFLPRDFMKFGQLMLDEGTWKGRRILPKAWVERSSSSLVDMNGTKRMYGYLWWITDSPYQGRRIQGYAALGNGGQNVIVIPELDMVVAFYCGNYAEKAMNKPIRHIMPELIFPAVTGK